MSDYGAHAITWRDGGSGVEGVRKVDGARVEARLIDQTSGHARKLVNVDSTVLRWLYNEGLLGEAEQAARSLLDAGERLQHDFEDAGLRQKVCGRYGEQSGGSKWDRTDAQEQAVKRFRKAIQAMGKWSGNVVWRVCLNDESPRPVDLAALRCGLRELAQHYGL